MTHRRTKIVATMGPACDSEVTVKALIRAGVNVFRFNMSHGSHDEHERRIATVRKAAAELEEPIGVLVDLQGPKIRTGRLRAAPVTLKEGQRFTLTTRAVDGDESLVSTTYAELPHDVVPGQRILVDDGHIELKVLSTSTSDVVTEVLHGGRLHHSKGINLPGVDVSAPALTDKDRDDVEFAVAHDVEYIALSFVRRARDIRKLKRYLHHLGAPKIPVIAKIEKPQAVENLDEILVLADAIMLARGDLGVEVPAEELPVIQKRVIALANIHGVPVITATQMLESMIHKPRPTRAEATDVANAVFDGSDAVMLSGETATGAFPVRAVETMERIAREAGRHREIFQNSERLQPSVELKKPTFAEAISRATLAASKEMDVQNIVVFTYSGFSAQLMAQLRPTARIIAFTPYERTYRMLALCWGVVPQRLEIGSTTDELLYNGEMALLERGLAVKGEVVVIISGTTTLEGATNMMKIRRLGD